MTFKFLLFLVVSCLLSSTALASDEMTGAAELTFEVFSRKVLDYYPRLKAVHSDIDVALARKIQAQSGFWPSLDVSAGYQISNDPVNVFGMLLRQERFTSSDFDLKRLNTPDRHQDLSAGVHAQWPLFDAMQTIGRVRSARENLKASQSDEAFTIMEARLIAQDAYLNALTLDKLLFIIEEVQKNSADDLKKAKDLKDKGMVLGADYYASRVLLGDFIRMKNELSRQKVAMTALLNILMGESPEKVWLLTSTIKEAGSMHQDSRELIKTALVDRPDISSMRSRLQAFDSDLSREQSAIFPRLSAFADAVNGRNKVGASGGNNYTVGVKAELPLFDPSRDGRVKEAKARKARLEHDMESLKDTISRDIVEETARYDTFLDNTAVLKGMADDAKVAVSFVVPLYSEGRKSIADLLEARRTYLQSAQAYQKAVMGIWLSEARLLFLTGQLNTDGMKQFAEGAGL